MAYLEIEYLYELHRLRLHADEVLAPLTREIGLRVCETSFAAVAREAFADAWTRDPFDRLIVAQARVHKAKLLTLDEKILRYYPLALE
jgi:PIN domain nuclease of toxin-antitoxin system